MKYTFMITQTDTEQDRGQGTDIWRRYSIRKSRQCLWPLYLELTRDVPPPCTEGIVERVWVLIHCNPQQVDSVIHERSPVNPPPVNMVGKLSFPACYPQPCDGQVWTGHISPVLVLISIKQMNMTLPERPGLLLQPPADRCRDNGMLFWCVNRQMVGLPGWSPWDAGGIDSSRVVWRRPAHHVTRLR